MYKFLVILESPCKVKKVKSFLDKQYEVIASMGHISDLPKKKLGVNLKNGNFTPTFEIYSEKKEIVKNIKLKAKKSDVVYLMTDLDREGEQISRTIADILPNNVDIKRATTNSITKQAVLDAIINAGEIDQDMVNAYETRRILDRLVGYRTSFLTKQATGGRSAGRVQSAVLRMLAEKEKKILLFIPQEYWDITAKLKTKKNDIVDTIIKKPKFLDIKNKEQADKICNTFKNNIIKVSKFGTKEISIKAYAPFKTSTLLQSAAVIFNWSSDKTAKIAQDLYQNGKISYHRTDSVYIVPEFIEEIRNTITIKYGNNYLPDKQNYYFNKKQAQEAHEAIRVTDLSDEVGESVDAGKLYKMIWKRTVQSQMVSMKQMRTTAEFSCKNNVLSAMGNKVIFDGFRKCWDYGTMEESDLPLLKVGEEVDLIDIKTEQKFTQPPPRYNERSIIKTMEVKGIGRPSTYVSTIKTLIDRKYIEKKNKQIYVTDLGLRVIDFLIECDFCFIDINFTVNMENDLDLIAKNKKNKLEILSDFWDRLKNDIINAKNKKLELEKTNFKCEKCGGNLLLKNSFYGPFLSCSNRTNKKIKCDYKANVGEHGELVEQVKKEKEVKYSEEHKCPNCGSYLVVRINKKGGEYLGCENWKQKGCQGFYGMDGEKIIFQKKKYKKRKKKGQ